jgi:hypothetical protein
MLSIVYSTRDAGLARLGQLLADVEAAARAMAAGQGSGAGLAAQLAGAWALVAELDPALAVSLAGYRAVGDEARGAAAVSRW